MNQSKLHAHGFQKNRRKLRYFGTQSTLSTIALSVAITMSMYTKCASSFTPLLHACVSTSPVSRAINIYHSANRITSKGNVRHRSNHSRFRQSPTDTDVDSALPPVLVAEGLFAVDKPLEWTSQDAVSFIRGMFERDARSRGANPGKIGSRKNKNLQVIRCGHGGTLDPLATGVLVIGLGNGTKLLQGYLTGSKGYLAEGTFGFETESLDMGTNVTKNEKFDHITRESLEEVIPHFRGKYLQDPPMYSAIHKDGKRLHELARMGMTPKDVEIKARAVEVYELNLIDFNSPKFNVEVFSASGFYVRSLIRDIGYSLDTVATTTKLRRIKQGPFTIDHVLSKDDWTVEKINEAIVKFNAEADAVITNDAPPEAEQM